MNTNKFYDALINAGMDFFVGVPDSLLKEFCACISDRTTFEKNIIAANEGNALSIAAGHYLSTENPAVVYMQNSGEGNIVNPLLSLLDVDVYNIPALLIIGWRGEPNIKDEPQHIKQGKVTLNLLDVLGVKYAMLEDIKQINEAKEYMLNTKKPFAFIVRKGLFDEYSNKPARQNKYELSREDAIKKVLSMLSDKDIVISTTGMISREIYENRDTHEKDFLTVGSMGHASSIAFGIALNKPDRNVFCFDGDGACIMHMGAMGVIASRKLKNFKHIIFNNESHDSVGGQPTVASFMNLSKIAENSGYDRVFDVKTMSELLHIWDDFYNSNCTSLLEIKVKSGNRPDIGRPKEKPTENKNAFMQFVKEF